MGSHIKWLNEKWPPSRPIWGESMAMPIEAIAANHQITFNSWNIRNKKIAAKTIESSINKFRIPTIDGRKSIPQFARIFTGIIIIGWQSVKKTISPYG
ncbi:hypothetical protein MASR2M47_05570 [Draconibacterium sp.]